MQRSEMPIPSPKQYIDNTLTNHSCILREYTILISLADRFTPDQKLKLSNGFVADNYNPELLTNKEAPAYKASEALFKAGFIPLSLTSAANSIKALVTNDKGHVSITEIEKNAEEINNLTEQEIESLGQEVVKVISIALNEEASENIKLFAKTGDFRREVVDNPGEQGESDNQDDQEESEKVFSNILLSNSQSDYVYPTWGSDPAMEIIPAHERADNSDDQAESEKDFEEGDNDSDDQEESTRGVNEISLNDHTSDLPQDDFVLPTVTITVPDFFIQGGSTEVQVWVANQMQQRLIDDVIVPLFNRYFGVEFNVEAAREEFLNLYSLQNEDLMDVLGQFAERNAVDTLISDLLE